METLKTTVRCAVLAFVFVAGAVTIAGLDPDSKAQAESMAEEKQKPEGISLGGTQRDAANATLGSTG